MKKEKKFVDFVYTITNPCMKIWVERNISDKRLHELLDNGCRVSCMLMGKQTI